ncbi:A/G-specific adenine glycosylase [Pusillimonas sp. CC-YST705]|uniref:Adenine DNA glycosylase n=1 Tax=Mesopusillimonas faecipullorum TaxID=2755040 RepID=A0ABS8CBZ3_9BURK|nr:A/G-specific adenine glycosylase [Mesopusillimonas faecipullorum]MCB5363556.1 A/G-specific adenine glycosylase [Mesopusillimonas faecipullorum]
MPALSLASTAGFAQTVVAWQRVYGRHDLPWQGTRDPYRIWLSEIMLQQTQVATVIAYYTRFLERFPDVQALAAATQDEVMPYWAGLGYYARARNLHRCAQIVCEQWQGRFPTNPEDLQQLPGIGRSTAAAIAAFSTGMRTPILDGNVKRVFARYFSFREHPGLRLVEQRMWALAEDIVAQGPADLDMVAYTQGMMDLGASLCSRGKPQCDACPLAQGCQARADGTQHLIPAPKPRKAIPERECHVLILENAQAVLLQRRPSSGIWGGLWTLPQFDTEAELQQACRHYGLACAKDRRMASMVHVFTHFKLTITPWHLTNASVVTEPAADQQWAALSRLPSVALPAPIKKLLEGLYPTHGTQLL